MEQVYGLVVCGGQSTRMSRDKSLLNYHGFEQRYYMYDLLGSLCKKVFISCNAVQANTIGAGYEFIPDHEKYRDIGPMAALLSAFEQYPDNGFLVIGCDYPFIKKEDIVQLMNNRKEKYPALSFFNEEEKLYEPLLSVYEIKMLPTLRENFLRQQYSLQSVLKQVNSLKIYPRNITAIKSIDTYRDHLMAIEQIKRETSE